MGLPSWADVALCKDGWSLIAYGSGMIRTAILAISGQGQGDETLAAGLEALRRLLQMGPFVEVEYLALPAEQAVLRSKLRLLSDNESADLVLTLGGVGLGLKERVPEATREVLEREAPGFAERVRSAWLEHDPKALLYRGVCGVRRRCLILNLPGEADAVEATLSALLPSLPIAVEALSQLPQTP